MLCTNSCSDVWRSPLQEGEDENAELDEENQEGKLAWAGGREEAATYEAGDAEDARAAAAARKAAEQQAGERRCGGAFPPICCGMIPLCAPYIGHGQPPSVCGSKEALPLAMPKVACQSLSTLVAYVHSADSDLRCVFSLLLAAGALLDVDRTANALQEAHYRVLIALSVAKCCACLQSAHGIQDDDDEEERLAEEDAPATPLPKRRRQPVTKPVPKPDRAARRRGGQQAQKSSKKTAKEKGSTAKAEAGGACR